MQKSLRDGLILRSFSEGHSSDQDDLVPFYKEIFSVYEDDGWNEQDDIWARRLLSGKHPTVSYDDVWVVVDPAKDDKIVSTTLLIPQVWRYAGIDIPVGRPELVATHPDYRNRGLIRALFEVCHERSAALGHKLLGITGIPYYYRRFGYTMAVDLGDSGYVPLRSIPELKEGESTQYTLRPATEADYPQLSAWTAYMADQLSLSVVRDASAVELAHQPARAAPDGHRGCAGRGTSAIW